MAYYLEDLNRVHSLSFEQLGEWKKKYPYSQMVHFLLAKKCQLEGLIDNMSVFHNAALYSVDRPHLHDRMKYSEAETYEKEDSYEFDPIEEAILEPLPVDEEKTEVQSETDIIHEIIEIEESEFLEEKIKETHEEKLEEKPILKVEDKAPTMTGSHINEVANEEFLSPFAMWLGNLKPIDQEKDKDTKTTKKKKKKKSKTKTKVDLKSKKKKKKKKKRDSKKGRLRAQIESSVIQKGDIISEPLAQILAMQGHKENAIEMYKKLSLIFPEKSSFFASQIEKINKS